MQMTDHYRLYVFDRNNHVTRTLALIASDKKAATVRARMELRADAQAHAYELWQNARRVQKEFWSALGACIERAARGPTPQTAGQGAKRGKFGVRRGEGFLY